MATTMLIDDSALHKHALARLEAADKALAYADHSHLKDVHQSEDITEAWLTTVLSKGVPGAEVTEVRPIGGHEGMTSRSKLEVIWNEQGRAAGLPAKIFVKTTPKNPHLLEMLSMLHMAELEVEFYNTCASDVAEFVPVCYYARSHPGGRFIILLEVLEDREITPHWMGDTCDIDYAYQVAIMQAKVHARFWETPRFSTDMVFVRPRSRRLGEQWLETMFHRVRKNFLASEIGLAVPQYVREIVELWNENCDKFYAYWDTKPATIVHGDSHLGNVLQFKDGTAGFYDWQCFFKGYGFRDLSYFLMSALTVEDVKGHERKIFDTYVDTLAAEGVKVDREEAWLDYCLLALERFDSAMTPLTQGGYGHARHALERQVKTLTYVLQEHDVATLMRRVLKTGSIRQDLEKVDSHAV